MVRLALKAKMKVIRIPKLINNSKVGLMRKFFLKTAIDIFINAIHMDLIIKV